MISKMKVEELKSYLKLRGIKLNGKKKELVARIFASIENNVLPIKNGADVKLKTSHTYYTQSILQMAVIRCSVAYFVVWTPYSIVIDKINFNVSFVDLLNEKFINYCKDYYLKLFFSK